MQGSDCTTPHWSLGRASWSTTANEISGRTSSDSEPQESWWQLLGLLTLPHWFWALDCLGQCRHMFFRDTCSRRGLEMSVGKPGWFQTSWFRGSPAFLRSSECKCPHYVPPWRDQPRHQETTYPESSQSPLYASPTWHFNSHTPGILTIFTALPSETCQAGTLVRSCLIKDASAIMETRGRGTCCKRKGNFSQCHSMVSISSSLGSWPEDFTCPLKSSCYFFTHFIECMLPLFENAKNGHVNCQMMLMLSDVLKGPRRMLNTPTVRRAQAQHKQAHLWLKQKYLLPSHRDSRGQKKPRVV